jgi:hypothetical protein
LRKTRKRKTVVTILETGEELNYESTIDAAKAMCIAPSTINKLIKKATKGTCKGGEYAIASFAVRFCD